MAALAWSQVWQLAVLAAVVGLVTRCACTSRPHLAYLLWMLVIVKSVTPPLWKSPVGVFSWTQVETGSSSAAAPAGATIGEEAAGVLAPDRGAPSRTAGERRSAAGDGAPEPLAAARGRPPIDAALTLGAADSVSEERGGTGGASIASAPVGSRPFPLTVLVLAAWGAGSLLLGGLAVRQWVRARRLIACSAVPYGPLLRSVLDDLKRELGIRRSIRMLVTRERIVPTVFGTLRPTVLLSDAVVACASPAELRALVAHELVHVRRRDLLAGWMQIVSQTLWWFHPAVWLANRRACRERERCCDEEVVAGLRCRAADYARSLLKVLEIRRQLVPTFGALGVRPVEVTSRRLEEIMRRADSFRRRTPVWCWGVAVAAAALVLPGRGLVLTAGGEASPERELRTKAALDRTLDGHVGGVRSMAFSPDGAMLACGSGREHHSGEVVLWDPRSGALERSLRGHKGAVHALAFTPDGNRLVTASDDSSVIIWNVATGEEVQKLRVHASAFSLAVTQDGERLVVGRGDGSAQIWSLADGSEGATLVHSLGARLRSVALSPDSRTLATSGDGSVKLWDMGTGAKKWVLRAPAAGAAVFSPDGTLVAAVNGDLVTLRDAVSGVERATVRSGNVPHTSPGAAIEFSPDDAGLLAIASSDGVVRLWSRSGEVQSTVGSVGDAPASAIGFSPDGAVLAAASGDRVTLWRLSTPTEFREEQSGAAELRRIAEGYLENRKAFPFFHSKFTIARGRAASLGEALEKGPTVDRLTARASWTVDGANVCYFRRIDEAAREALNKSLADPQETEVGGRKVALAAIPLDGLGVLTDGKRMLRYDPGFVVNLMGPNRIGELITGVGPELTPWGLGGMGQTLDSNPGSWILEGRYGPYTSQGVREVDGTEVYVVTAGTPGGTHKEYRFDPARGYLAVRRNTTYASGARSVVCVTDARECSGGRWFPTRTVSVLLHPGGAVKRVTEIVVVTLYTDARPERDEFTFEIEGGIQVVHVDNLRSFFKLPATGSVGLDDLERLHSRSEESLEKREREALERKR